MVGSEFWYGIFCCVVIHFKALHHVANMKGGTVAMFHTKLRKYHLNGYHHIYQVKDDKKSVQKIASSQVQDYI